MDEALWGGRLPWYRDWVTNTHRQDPYWNEGFWKFMADAPRKLQIPVCIVEGWYDHHLGSAMQSFQNLSPKAAAHSKLLVGCWNHGFGPCAEGKEQNHLENNEVIQMLAWFEETLRQERLPERSVEWYVIGEDRWRSWKDLPKGQETESFYLDTEGFSLIQEPGREGSHSYVYDPENPVPSHGAESLFSTFQEVGSLLQPEPGYREDVLSFLSDPLPEDLTVLGQVTAELYVKSEAEDTAFTAKLMEVTPEGKSYNIRGSIATLAYEAPYHPGEVRKPARATAATVLSLPLTLSEKETWIILFLNVWRNAPLPWPSWSGSPVPNRDIIRSLPTGWREFWTRCGKTGSEWLPTWVRPIRCQRQKKPEKWQTL